MVKLAGVRELNPRGNKGLFLEMLIKKMGVEFRLLWAQWRQNEFESEGHISRFGDGLYKCS